MRRLAASEGMTLRSSDPLVGGLERELEATDEGNARREQLRSRLIAVCVDGLVETRRLELLTLSLQRRCSSS